MKLSKHFYEITEEILMKFIFLKDINFRFVFMLKNFSTNANLKFGLIPKKSRIFKVYFIKIFHTFPNKKAVLNLYKIWLHKLFLVSLYHFKVDDFKIGEHSSFSIINEILFKANMEVWVFNDIN